MEHLPHQYRNGAYDSGAQTIKTFVFILNDCADERKYNDFKQALTGQFNDKMIFGIKMSVPRHLSNQPPQVPGDLWGSYRDLDLR